jgi:NAD(P)-dependent dehydrogenase (short-subunit alcohol dehydrogenase family)
MKKWSLVTGASSGIGRAVAIRLANEPNSAVIAVARRETELLETQKMAAGNSIQAVVADVGTEEGREIVISAVESISSPLKNIVHNAGMIGKIGRATEIDLESWRQTFAVNVDAPFFLTQKLVSHMTEGGRILHIGSGAAHNSFDGWSTYCTTKAALFMMYKCLRDELKEHDILVGSLKPGIVESDMQQLIRQATEKDMAAVDAFRAFKSNEYSGDSSTPHAPPPDGLDTAENVAHFVRFLLTETSKNEFGTEEWDIRNALHHPRWGAV